MLHVLLNGFGWGGLYETSNDFIPGGTPPAGSAATATGVKNGCLVPECSNLHTASYALTAVGTALSILAEGMHNATTATRMAFEHTPNPMLNGGVKPSGLTGSVSYPSLLGVQFSDAIIDGDAHASDTLHHGHYYSEQEQATGQISTAVVLNLSGKQVMYNNSLGECTAYTVYSSPGQDPAAWATSSTPVKAVRVDHPPTSGLSLPPYSITAMSMTN
jgi:hypothetical protein